MMTADPVTSAGADDLTLVRLWRQIAGRPGLAIAGLTALVGGLPLVAALAAASQSKWYPLLDMAQIELQVRDVGSSDTPLVGPYGRMQGHGVFGNHPGPLGFYGLAVPYRVAGSSAWALLVAGAAWSLAAVGTALWVAWRRRGLPLAVGLAGVLAVLVSAYGPVKLVLPWNPFLAMLWWIVLLLAAWGVVCGDLPLLPVAVFAGSYCVQNHAGYFGLVAVLAALAVAALAARAVADRRDRDLRGRLVPWGALSLALAGVLWLPPVIQQVNNSPGNLSIVWESFREPAMEPVGLMGGIDLWLRYLDPFALIDTEHAFAIGDGIGSPLVGGVVLVAWAATATAASRAAWRGRGDRSLVWLHAVVGVALMAGLITMTKVSGTPFHYLLLWAWGTLALAVLAGGWTVLTVVVRSPAAVEIRAQHLATVGGAALATLVLVSTLATTYAAAEHFRPGGEPNEGLDADTATLEVLAPSTADALASGDVPGGGADGRYAVAWSETAHSIPAAGMGLLLELERQGFDVGASTPFAAGEKWEMPAGEATAVVHYVIGSGLIEDWRATPAAVEVGYFEPRAPEELDEYDQLRALVVSELQAAGLHETVEHIDRNLLVVALDPDLPPTVMEPMRELLRLGLPAAVFVAPPGVARSG